MILLFSFVVILSLSWAVADRCHQFDKGEILDTMADFDADDKNRYRFCLPVVRCGAVL